MSFHTTGYQPAYPPTTTTTTDTNSITATTTTTTATNTGSATTTSTPTMVGRPAGRHADTLGLNWSAPDDRAKYLAATGLPPIYAAVINDDWELAATMLSAENMGMSWQLNPGHAPEWEKNLRDPKDRQKNNPDQDKLKQAIIDMAFALVDGSTINDGGCLHGSSLLTLCLKKHAPIAFLQQLIASIKTHAPDSLNLPDPSGRTPLYVAAENGEKDQVKLLLAEGADPLAKCNFQQIADNEDMPTAHEAAVTNKHEDVFEMLLEKSTETTTWEEHFQSGDDVLSLFKWTSRHDRDEVLALAGKFPRIKAILLNADDQSGSSEITRCIKNGEWPDTPFHPLGRSLLEKKPLFVAAAFGQADVFFRMLKMCIQDDTLTKKNIDLEKLITTFLVKAPKELAARLLDDWPEPKDSFFEVVSRYSCLCELSLDFEKYSTVLRMAWPWFDAAQRKNILFNTANHTHQHLSLVLSLGNISDEGFPWPAYQVIAALNQKTELYELAVAQSSIVQDEIARFKSHPQSINPALSAREILRARSTKLFDQFIEAGLNVQDLLESDNDNYLSLMADCNPARLKDWLQDCEFTVNAETLNATRTEAGRAALLALLSGEQAKNEVTSTNA